MGWLVSDGVYVDVLCDPPVQPRARLTDAALSRLSWITVDPAVAPPGLLAFLPAVAPLPAPRPRPATDYGFAIKTDPKLLELMQYPIGALQQQLPSPRRVAATCGEVAFNETPNPVDAAEFVSLAVAQTPARRPAAALNFAFGDPLEYRLTTAWLGLAAERMRSPAPSPAAQQAFAGWPVLSAAETVAARSIDAMPPRLLPPPAKGEFAAPQTPLIVSVAQFVLTGQAFDAPPSPVRATRAFHGDVTMWQLTDVRPFAAFLTQSLPIAPGPRRVSDAKPDTSDALVQTSQASFALGLPGAWTTSMFPLPARVPQPLASVSILTLDRSQQWTLVPFVQAADPAQLFAGSPLASALASPPGESSPWLTTIFLVMPGPWRIIAMDVWCGGAVAGDVQSEGL